MALGMAETHIRKANEVTCGSGIRLERSAAGTHLDRRVGLHRSHCRPNILDRLTIENTTAVYSHSAISGTRICV